MIHQARLKELLDYDPQTGKFMRAKIRTPGNQRYVGQPAGWIGAKGYRQICVDGRTYAAHRLAWLCMTGEWPKDQIDHINGDKDDNKFSNLREATKYQNQHNRWFPVTNTSGEKGVYYLARRRPWRAVITCKNRRIYLGCFFTKAEAAEAYIAAAKTYHGEFAKAFDL